MPTIVTFFVRAVTGLNRALFYAASGLVAVMVPVLLIEVVCSYGFDAPTIWATELATLLLGPYFLICGPYLLHTRGHVNLDLVRARLSPGWNRAFDFVNFPVIIFFCLVLLDYSWPFAVNALAFRETSTSAWNPQIWPVKFAIPLAMALMLLQAAAELLRVAFRDPRLEEPRS